MGNEVLITAIVGVIASVVLLVLSFRAGRSTPDNKVLWVIALVLLGISIAFRFIIVTGGVLKEQAVEILPVLIGNIAVIGVFVAALWQARLAGWVLIGSAVVMPLLTLILETAAQGEFPEESVAVVMMGSYSVPSIIAGTLLVLSMKQSKSSSRHTDEVASMPL